MTRDDAELYRTFARAAWPAGESRALSPAQRRAIVRGVRACLAMPATPDVGALDAQAVAGNSPGETCGRSPRRRKEH